MIASIPFEDGTFVCDRWPEDLQRAVGRTVVCPWKTIYKQVTDRIHCGRIVRAWGEGEWARVEIAIGSSGGSVISPLADCFLVPENAEGGA